ncbi:hypothetical protein KY285_037995 [Solanum tuberosum]|nr:hypothetical protein KY285_037995 [Solanum tuberosum]
MEATSYMFGPYKIDKKEVFYSTDFSYALVNLRPLLPGVKYNALLSLLLMRLATCGLQHKKLANNLSHTTRHLLLHLQSKMDPRQDRQFLMFIFTSSHGKVAILKRMMRFMML